jgi:trigger factor
VDQFNKRTKTKIEKKPKCIIELEVETSFDLVKDAKKEALKELKKEITISGFRKGKAPDELILKKYPEAFKNKLEKKIADLAFIESHKNEKLPSLSSGSKIIYKLLSYSLEQGAKIHFTYETEPEVPAIDTKDFKLKSEKKPEITQKEVDEAIRQIRFFHANWSEVTRPIQEGDYVIIDLDSLESTSPQRVFSDTRFEVSDKGMAQWMKKLVIDSKVGDLLEGMSEPDEDAPLEEKEKFKPKKVLVTIKKIEEATLPELNDEFAKKVGALSIKEMKESIKNMLIQQAERKHNQENRKKVNEFLLKNYKFEIPDSLLKSEIEYRKNTYLKNPEFKKKYDNMPQKEKEELEKEIIKHSEAAIRIFYISKKIVTDYKINISDEEIKQEAINIIYNELGKKPEPKDIPKDIYALAFSRLVLTKAEDYVLDQSQKT